jgi:hypothetical protein
MYGIIEDKSLGGRMIFHSPPPTDPETVTQGIFGMSVSRLVQEILHNKDGQYDRLYESEAATA